MQTDSFIKVENIYYHHFTTFFIKKKSYRAF